jgi:anti-sigma regulatory factor (Ser/Thr protein kinase)
VSPNTPETLATLVIPARPDYLSVCRQALAGAVGGIAVSDDALEDLKLVLSEMCANAIVHGYGANEGLIEVEFCTSDEEIVLTVTDHGAGFGDDLASVHRGMGMSLLEHLCDRHTIEPNRSSGGASVSFSRALPA